MVWVGSGGGWWQTLVVSQRVSPVTLRTTFRNHVNEAGELEEVPPLQSYLLSKFLGSTRAIARGFSSQQLNCVDEIQIKII